MKTKTCALCKEDKPLEDFHNRKSSKDGKQSRCKPCAIAGVRKWQEENPEMFKENWLRQALKPTRSFERRARIYGITPQELASLIEKANGLCDLRGNPPTRWLVVDHCHKTGKVRGMLCSNCNTGLGLFKDDPERLQSAIEYLNKSRASNSNG